MENIKIRYPSLLDIVLIAIGLSMLAFLIDFESERLKAIWEAAGTSITAAGLLNWLIRNILAEEKQRNKEVQILTSMRVNVNRKIYDAKRTAEKVDLLGVSLTGAINDYIEDQILLRNIIEKPVRVRIIFLNPFSELIKTKTWEDGLSYEELQKNLARSIVDCEEIYKKLDAIMSMDKSKNTKTRGSLSIKLIDHHPIHSLYRCDSEIYWGLYTSHKKGTSLPLIKVHKDNVELYESLHDHFIWLWDHPSMLILQCSDIQQNLFLDKEFVNKCKNLLN